MSGEGEHDVGLGAGIDAGDGADVEGLYRTGCGEYGGGRESGNFEGAGSESGCGLGADGEEPEVGDDLFKLRGGRPGDATKDEEDLGVLRPPLAHEIEIGDVAAEEIDGEFVNDG